MICVVIRCCLSKVIIMLVKELENKLRVIYGNSVLIESIVEGIISNKNNYLRKRLCTVSIILLWENEIKKFYRMNNIGHLYEENNDNILLKSLEMINTLSNMTLHDVFFILNEDIENELRIIVENTSERYKEYKRIKRFDNIWVIFDEVYKYYNYLETLFDESNIRDIIWLMEKYKELK